MMNREPVEMNRGYAKRKETGALAFLYQALQSEWLPFLFLFIAMLALHSRILMDTGDDAWFLEYSQKYSLPGFIGWRYSWWTGRVSVESVLYFIFKDGGGLWRILNPMFIVLFAYSVSRITMGRHATERNPVGMDTVEMNIRDRDHRRSMNWFIALGWLYMHKIVMADTIFWMTGSINYIWTIAAGLFALIPFRDAVAGEFRFSWRKMLYLIPAAFAGMGQEQIAIIMTVFAVIINIQLVIRHKKANAFLVLETLVIIGSFLILYIAPGNVDRVHAETNTWLPNYPLYTTLEIGYNGLQWLLDGIINLSRTLLLMVTVSLGIAVYRKYDGVRNGVFTLAPFIASGLLLVGVAFLVHVELPDFIAERITFPQAYLNLGVRVDHYLFNFYNDFELYSFRTIKYMGWTVLLLLIPFYIYALYGFTLKSMYSNLIYLAGLSSSIIMFISPTIYASGARTIFVMNVAFFILFIFLLRDMEWLHKKRYIILFALLPLFKYLVFYRAFFQGLLWNQL